MNFQGLPALLSEILNNTLDISKLEEGKIEFNNSFEAINNAIDVVLSIAKSNAEKKELSWKLIMPLSCLLFWNMINQGLLKL